MAEEQKDVGQRIKELSEQLENATPAESARISSELAQLVKKLGQ